MINFSRSEIFPLCERPSNVIDILVTYSNPLLISKISKSNIDYFVVRDFSEWYGFCAIEKKNDTNIIKILCSNKDSNKFRDIHIELLNYIVLDLELELELSIDTTDRISFFKEIRQYVKFVICEFTKSKIIFKKIQGDEGFNSYLNKELIRKNSIMGFSFLSGSGSYPDYE